jgi:hypothetical protein
MIVGTGNHHQRQPWHRNEQPGATDNGNIRISGAQRRPTSSPVRRSFCAVQRHRAGDACSHLVTDIDTRTDDQGLPLSNRHFRGEPTDQLRLFPQGRWEHTNRLAFFEQKINIQTDPFTLGGQPLRSVRLCSFGFVANMLAYRGKPSGNRVVKHEPERYDVTTRDPHRELDL